MKRDRAAFLRGISNVPMQPLRAALESLGFRSVGSFGASGNLFFCMQGADDAAALEAMIEQAVHAEAIVRSRAELALIVARDPYAGCAGAAAFLAKRPVEPTLARALSRGEFRGDPPVVDGSTVYFVHPTQRLGRRGVVDFERELGVRGTMRSSRVLARVLESM